MIAANEKDRDVLRFIWIDDLKKSDPDLHVYRFSRVVISVSSRPFLLNATVKYHLERFLDSNGDTVKHLLQSMYVDSIISGADSSCTLKPRRSSVKEVSTSESFCLTAKPCR